MFASVLKKLNKAVVFSTFMLLAETAFAKTVGISLPNYDVPRFTTDAESMQQELQKDGIECSILYADFTAEQQIADIEKLIEENCDILVIVPYDGTSLTEVLKKAKARNIPVIAYDRLIMNSDAVSYYTTFDNYKVGYLIGSYLEDKLKLNTDETSPKTIEFFAGDLGDNNAKIFWDGSMEVLEPYLASGKLICKSDETKLEQASTQDWTAENARNRMLRLIDEFKYGASEGETPLDAVYCMNDSVAKGVVEAIYKNTSYKKGNFPVITGQDCTKLAVKYIRHGVMSMSIFKDARILAYSTAQMIRQILNKESVDVNDTSSYNNGVKTIPTLLCSPKVVDKDNVREIIIDSGYYNAADIK